MNFLDRLLEALARRDVRRRGLHSPDSAREARFEVFDVRHGAALRSTRSERRARRLAARDPWLDYARQDDGWTS